MTLNNDTKLKEKAEAGKASPCWIFVKLIYDIDPADKNHETKMKTQKPVEGPNMVVIL